MNQRSAAWFILSTDETGRIKGSDNKIGLLSFTLAADIFFKGFWSWKRFSPAHTLDPLRKKTRLLRWKTYGGWPIFRGGETRIVGVLPPWKSIHIKGWLKDVRCVEIVGMWVSNVLCETRVHHSKPFRRIFDNCLEGTRVLMRRVPDYAQPNTIPIPGENVKAGSFSRSYMHRLRIK